MKGRKLAVKKHKRIQEKGKKHLCSSVSIFGFISFCLVIFAAWFYPNSTQKVSAADTDSEIEKALFTKQEFFGAEAIVPLPTAEARENLARLFESAPDNSEILEKLAGLDEKLLRFDEAEKNFIHLAKIDKAKLENLAAFYQRRGEFEEEAKILEKILFSTEPEKRGAALEKLIDSARIHDLKSYLQTNFYAQVAKENPNVYTIFETLIDKLKEEKNYTEALNFVRQARTQFPQRQSVLLEKEIEILLETNNATEAETIYQAAFNPFWSDEEADKFYDFLNGQDRLRAYGAELKTIFRKNPADFDAAIRLALYQNHDYSYGNDEITPVILKLEQAKKNWTTEELVTVTRLLLRTNEADLGSRFLYTLYVREDFQKNAELRAKVLYQLFEMFSDAESRRLPITKGDLRFYEDVGRADTRPGIMTGILSLIFSDTNPRKQLDEQENAATEYFNRAAAYRIFEEYKKEFPTSSELAQMYLDIVRLYAATGETEIADKTLNEFAERFENSSDYVSAAMKLADAFVAVKQDERAREVYQKVLDYLGKTDKAKQKNFIGFSADSNNPTFEIDANRNDGINIPKPEATPKDYYYSNEDKSVFKDYLSRENAETTYEEVLNTLVASLAKEKKTAEILALYSNEINKYPNEEWLYEQRLSWLEQTNLTEEQLQVYQTALARFQSRGWQDKLARFFLRQKRNDEFAALSEDLVGKLNDTEAQNYLSQFVDGKMSSTVFEKQLYLKLYESAHTRFPHNIVFVNGLLRFYKAEKQEKEWRKLAAEYYFESKDMREQFLDNLAQKGELRSFLANANGDSTIYELFRADASVRLSNFENAVAAYRKLNQIYLNEEQFSSRLINFTRSFGQKSPEMLAEAANISHASAEFLPSSTEYRTQSGEIYAELGDYEKARGEWGKLISTGAGAKETYLDTATVYWDYFQYDDALRAIQKLREKFSDDALYAFETGAIFEAQHKEKQAIGEYVKALDANRDETQKEKAMRRLTNLFSRENKILQITDSVFEFERKRRKDASFLALGYAEFLAKIKQNEKADSMLNRTINQSKNNEFLEAAKGFYQSEYNESGEQIALKQLADVSNNPRQEIAYRLQLTQSFEENNDRDRAKITLDELVRKFPANYGVVCESTAFYYRLGFESEAINVLQSALLKSKGSYRNALAQQLGERLVQLNRLDPAAQILERLHGEDKIDIGVFDELAKIYVRQNNAEKLRKAFNDTVTAVKETDGDRRELNEQIADLRIEMIDAFTRLKDYKSAIEQHIEIINREPENDELIDNAIAYAQRYGGAEALVSYYQKTSAEAFKNYRWNVVLARIYETDKDFENAAKNYQEAIVNQPEMPELYVSLADVETKRNNFDEALRNIDKVLELTNDEAQYVKKKIEILKKAGKLAEIEAEKAKLPVEDEQKPAINQFEEAQKLQNTEKEKAREIYREAFAKLLQNPLVDELKAANISAYVQSLREEDPLNQISERLWQLREKLITIADKDNSTDAGEARKRLGILDAAIPDSIGTIAKTVGTDAELAALHQDLQSRIEEFSFDSDNHQIVSLVQNLSRRAGFGDLEEKILLKKLDETNSSEDKKTQLQVLLNFYNERGAYQKSFDILEKYGSDNLPLKADTARIVGSKEKELEALRAIYWKSFEKISVASDENVERYLEILYAENRLELKSLSEKSSFYQLQLINFLLGKGERELAHSAIENANLSLAWKASRNAETSLALKEFDTTAECYFCDALQMDSIGSLIGQTPDKKHFLINDDWFRLSREYGEWLFEKKENGSAPAKFLTAMIENLPQNTDEQAKLGTFYLERNELKAAIEHFRLALEIDAGDKTTWANLGAAYFKFGRKDYAEESWANVLDGEEVKSGLIYFQVLRKNGLAPQAHEKLLPIIVKFLQTNNAVDSEDFQNLIRAVAASFGSETEKSAYFLQILSRRPTDTSLATMLVNESLIGKNEQKEFYELLISRSSKSDSYDYDYKSAVERTWTVSDAESVYDLEKEYKTEEPENEHFEWEKKYLGILTEERDNTSAKQIATQIEKEISGHNARPAWLRLTRLTQQIRDSKFDQSIAERFIGISVSDFVTDIKPPSLARFNDVLQILRDEKRDAEANALSEAFFARMLALEQFDAANFLGLVRAFFQKGETQKALRILQLLIDAGDENKREMALAEITSLDIVKAQMADATKLPETKSNFTIVQTEALKLAAEISAQFEQTQAAEMFRLKLLEFNNSDWTNQIELAKLLVAEGKKSDAANLLNKIIENRNALRSIRWQARLLLREIGENADFPNAEFDSFSQFYQGIFGEKTGENESATKFFINALIDDKDTEATARQELIKTYISLNKPSAALKIAEADKSEKSDELLQMLSDTAEKVGNFGEALKFEKAKNSSSKEKISRLQQLADAQKRNATDFTVDLENTRKL
jgi:tetratricopeptide (TPR) repeat protein